MIDLQRFIDGQEGIYETALAELKTGSKRSHWIWFIFPQVAGLGFSTMAARYAINSKEEAKAYLAHPILGARLRVCANALLAVRDKTALQIMGHPDDLKLKSSMTLFAAVAELGSPFQAMLDRYYSGEVDPRTTEFLSRDGVSNP